MVLPHKGGSLCVKDAFAKKKFFGAGRDSAVGLSRGGYATERTRSPVVPPTRSSPAGGRKFDKAKSTGRIDVLVALAMALSLAPVQRHTLSPPPRHLASGANDASVTIRPLMLTLAQRG